MTKIILKRYYLDNDDVLLNIIVFEQEKSKLDWNSFKQDEGIEEELQIHNRGKSG